MQEDKKLEKIIKAQGLVSPSSDFTQNVIAKIKGESIATSFRPIIGKRGRLIGLAIVSFIILFTIFGGDANPSQTILNIPQWDLKMPDISLAIPKVVLAGFAAVFILVLSDAGIRRYRT